MRLFGVRDLAVAATLWPVIENGFSDAPTDPCIWWRGDWWSRGAFAELADECEARLREGGFGKGSRLAFAMPNCPEVFAFTLAAWRLGGSTASVDVNLASPKVPEYIASLEPFAAIVAETRPELADAIARAGTKCALSPLLGEPPSISGAIDHRRVSPNVALTLHTEGDGRPARAVEFTHEKIAAVIASIREAIPSMNEDDVMLNAISHYHAIGAIAGGIMPLALGMPQVMLSSVRPPRSAIRAMRETGVTIVPTTPKVLELLLAEPPTIPLPKTRMLFCGGGAIRQETEARAKLLFGTSPLHGWGVTATGGACAVERPGQERAGSYGLALSCFDISVRADDGSELPRGEVGRLRVAWRGGEVIETDARASIDEDGYLFLQ